MNDVLKINSNDQIFEVIPLRGNRQVGAGFIPISAELFSARRN